MQFGFDIAELVAGLLDLERQMERPSVEISYEDEVEFGGSKV